MCHLQRDREQESEREFDTGAYETWVLSPGLSWIYSMILDKLSYFLDFSFTTWKMKDFTLNRVSQTSAHISDDTWINFNSSVNSST